MPAKEGIRKLFDSIAPDYDRLNHMLSLDIDKSWRRKAIKEALGSGQPLDILDVACGTGDFAIGMAKSAPAGSRITGIDISENMLSIGREKVRAAGLDGCVGLAAGDCEALPFADCTFDRATAAFGVRNFEHLETGLREMYRVLKPSGKTVILELSTPSGRIPAALYKLYFLNILPSIGGLVSGNRAAYRYLPESVLRFPRPEEFMKTMEKCGFSGIRHRSFTMGICRMYTGIRL